MSENFFLSLGHERNVGRRISPAHERVQPQQRLARALPVRRQVQRAAHSDARRRRVQLQAEAGLQARAGAQHNAGGRAVKSERTEK